MDKFSIKLGIYNVFSQQSSNKKYIIDLLIIVSFIYISLSLDVFLYVKTKKKSLFIKTQKKLLQTNYLEQENLLKYNTYNIYMNNKKFFYKYQNFNLLPGNNCPNKKLVTFFFKPEYPNVSYEYIQFQQKNISLKLKDKIYVQPIFFPNNENDFRKKSLKRLGFKLNTKETFHNLYITPYNINNTYKSKIINFIIDKYQKINKFFNYKEYASKSLLYINYKKFEDLYPLDYNYMLETYSYPEDEDKIRIKFYNYSLIDKTNLWMIKPTFGLGGLQISILTNFSNINLKNYILTKYLYNPHLIKGYKYDFRFHGLVSSIKPLKLYLYNEGLVRLTSEKYNSSEDSFTNNKFVFLTNLHINILNKKKFKYPQNLSNLEDSNLWNFETFKRYCAKNKINYDKIFFEVGEIFIKAMITVRENIIKDIEKNKLEYSNFYHLIGFDIILDENLKPYLLEMNRQCGFRNDNDAEKYFTYNIIADTLNKFISFFTKNFHL